MLHTVFRLHPNMDLRLCLQVQCLQSGISSGALSPVWDHCNLPHSDWLEPMSLKHGKAPLRSVHWWEPSLQTGYIFTFPSQTNMDRCGEDICVKDHLSIQRLKS